MKPHISRTLTVLSLFVCLQAWIIKYHYHCLFQVSILLTTTSTPKWTSVCRSQPSSRFSEFVHSQINNNRCSAFITNKGLTYLPLCAVQPSHSSPTMVDIEFAGGPQTSPACRARPGALKDRQMQGAGFSTSPCDVGLHHSVIAGGPLEQKGNLTEKSERSRRPRDPQGKPLMRSQMSLGPVFCCFLDGRGISTGSRSFRLRRFV